MCTHVSRVRRAPMSDVIPLGQTSVTSTSPRRGWVIVTVTDTCSSVCIPDCSREERFPEGKREKKEEEEEERDGTAQPRRRSLRSGKSDLPITWSDVPTSVITKTDSGKLGYSWKLVKPRTVNDWTYGFPREGPIDSHEGRGVLKTGSSETRLAVSVIGQHGDSPTMTVRGLIG
ncbi:hypothetical protein JZ751_015913 [Albula glossodonta]|uniref:Uncharacterized protein n=1 Tax=Albula glossodonta TaxID=121402 RepID=A0A8T2MKS3_9TELE|nr:hypothetical protein JZ751_015913 [Albula glossodonta]